MQIFLEIRRGAPQDNQLKIKSTIYMQKMNNQQILYVF